MLLEGTITYSYVLHTNFIDHINLEKKNVIYMKITWNFCEHVSEVFNPLHYQPFNTSESRRTSNKERGKPPL